MYYLDNNHIQFTNTRIEQPVPLSLSTNNNSSLCQLSQDLKSNGFILIKRANQGLIEFPTDILRNRKVEWIDLNENSKSFYQNILY